MTLPSASSAPTTLKAALKVIAAQAETIAAQAATICALEERLAKLEARLNQDSSNSSKPPSSDSPFKRPPPKSPTGRRPGGQVGHPGRHRKSDAPNHATLAAVPGEAALKYVEVIDETGVPLPVAPDQYQTVDGYLSMAIGGARTIPAGVVVTPPTPGPTVTGNTEGRPVASGVSGTGSSTASSGGCGVSESGNGTGWLWLGLLVAFAVRRATSGTPAF